MDNFLPLIIQLLKNEVYVSFTNKYDMSNFKTFHKNIIVRANMVGHDESQY